MTVRLSVSLPDDVHADLQRVAAASNISAGAVIRSVLSDALPRMTSVLEYLGTVPPARAADEVAGLDAWAAQMRALLHEAPPALEPFRDLMDRREDPGGES